jgi:hypothetical protein
MLLFYSGLQQIGWVHSHWEGNLLDLVNGFRYWSHPEILSRETQNYGQTYGHPATQSNWHCTNQPSPAPFTFLCEG